MSTDAMPAANNDVVATTGLLQVCLPPTSADELSSTLDHLAQAFPEQRVVVITDNDSEHLPHSPSLTVVKGSFPARSTSTFVPAAADYLNAWTASREQASSAILVLGPNPSSISARTMQRMVASVLEGRDLVAARYPIGTTDALINSSILYPFTRALFSNSLRYPLPIDVALSPRMSEVLATAAQHLTAANRSAAFIWPVAEAAFARFATCDVDGDDRALPQLTDASLDGIITTFVGSIFADAQAKAAFWQRAQLTGTSRPRDLAHLARRSSGAIQSIDPIPLVQAFQAGFDTHREAWSLILPPNSMLTLKRLSVAKPEQFVLPEALWARTVYDFFLAYRLLLLPRESLFLAFAPLYRAWMASHILRSGGDASRAEQLVEDVARAFESDKPYLIARWRWPDRFNP